MKQPWNGHISLEAVVRIPLRLVAAILQYWHKIFAVRYRKQLKGSWRSLYISTSISREADSAPEIALHAGNMVMKLGGEMSNLSGGGDACASRQASSPLYWRPEHYAVHGLAALFAIERHLYYLDVTRGEKLIQYLSLVVNIALAFRWKMPTWVRALKIVSSS